MTWRWSTRRSCRSRSATGCFARGIRLVEVAEAEFETLGCNALALAPRRCLMTEGNPQTRARLEAAGCEVLTYDASEISLKGQGGPTCLTRPLVRGEERAGPEGAALSLRLGRFHGGQQIEERLLDAGRGGDDFAAGDQAVADFGIADPGAGFAQHGDGAVTVP